MTQGLTEKVRLLADPAVRDAGAELVDLEFRREPVGWVLRLFVDRPGGVTLDDCQRISEVVGTLLEVEDPIPHTYTLEVSSPGLTRPLARPEDWRRAVGGMVKVVTRQPVAGLQSFVGRLARVDETGVTVDVGGQETAVPFDMVARARREIEWPSPSPSGRSGAGGRKGRSGQHRRKDGE